jgi:hypothetical protein
MLDYRGYGKSSGRIESEEQLRADVRAAWQAVAPQYAGKRTVIYGRSLGTALAAGLAAEVQPDLTILVSPYCSMRQLMRQHHPLLPPALLRYPLATCADAVRIDGPLLLVHGEQDTLIPIGTASNWRQRYQHARLFAWPTRRMPTCMSSRPTAASSCERCRRCQPIRHGGGGLMLKGLMQEQPLLISSLIEHAARLHPQGEIVSRTSEGPIHRCTYADVRRRAKQVANALTARGVSAGERIATLAWNGYRHMELYYGVSGWGRFCTRSIRASSPSRSSTSSTMPKTGCCSSIPASCRWSRSWRRGRPGSAAIVVLTDRAHMPASSLPDLLCYEELLAGQSGDFAWPQFDENSASSLCYTSGTTGNPKGVLYSHRSSVLHSLGRLRGRRAGDQPARDGPAGRADVPCQRLGNALRRRDERRAAGDAGSGARRAQRLRTDARRTRHPGARRADGLADAAAVRRGGRPAAAAGTVPAARRHRRFGGAAGDERALRDASSAPSSSTPGE